MKRRLGILVLGVAVVFGLETTAFGGNVTITFTKNTASYGGVGVGIYQGSVNGGPTLAQFVCDDFLHGISNNQSWTASVGSTNPTSSGLRFGPSNVSNPLLTGQSLTQQEIYNMVTYLALQIFSDPTNSHGNWGYLSWAIWSITDGAWNNPYYTSQVSSFVQAALARKDTNNGDLVVYTPVSGQPGQEFLSTPEPGSILLMGTCLTLAGLLLARKKMLSTLS